MGKRGQRKGTERGRARISKGGEKPKGEKESKRQKEGERERKTERK